MPSNRKRSAVFYGWWIVGACFIINLFVTGVIFSAFTAFFEPIVTEFGWSYAQVSLAASLRGLEMGLLAPVAGLIVDRYGPRRLVFTGAVFIGIGMALLSRVSNLALFYGAFVLINIGVSSCVGVVTATAVANWFRRKTSMAIGITVSSSAVGGLMVPVVTALIEALGWRMTVLSLGLWICGLTMALSLLLRHKPEQYGYLPDGAEESFQNIDQTMSTAEVTDAETKIGFRQVLASRIFWHIALTYFGAFAVITSISTHIMPYLSNLGITRGISSLLASAVPVVTIFGRLGFGWLGDRYSSKGLAAIAVSGIFLGLLLFWFISFGGIWLALPFIILFSIGWGGSIPMMSVLVRTYYSRSNFGTVLGAAMFVAAVGQVVGPTLAGWIFDVWGSYQGAWFVFAVLVFLSIIIMSTTPRASAGAKTDNKQSAR